MFGNTRTKITKNATLLLALLMVGVSSSSAIAQSATAESQELFTDLQLQPVASGFTAPHFLVTPPQDNRRFVLDLTGQVTILAEDGTPQPEPFLDLSDRMVELNEGYDERGLLGLAFHPDFQQNGRFFVYYSAPLRAEAPADWNHTSHLSEFRVSDDPNKADPDSERVILKIDQPQMNHNGGRIAFGPDRYLYVGLGDGGEAADVGEGHPPLGNGQDVTTLLGSILRIDIEQQPYGIPEDNPLIDAKVPQDEPYSGTMAREEIWAWGIRNAWGMAFDSQTGDLMVGDVGQILWEEANRIEKSGNYGWHLKEGTHGFNPQNMDEIIEDAPESGSLGKPLIDPVIEYRNAGGHPQGAGICVVGGHIYRGEEIPELQGDYVFGDWTSKAGRPAGVVFVSGPNSNQAGQGNQAGEEKNLWPMAVATKHDQYILGFGEDNDGELYVLASDKAEPSGTTGRVFKIIRQP